ncbi:MAG: helix-turn-helix transcriptional regulator, partial [Ruminococcaceae bacterium]|nr:helix-turn-helix transcriptional regulator [Oscillospiraceae bacterium]
MKLEFAKNLRELRLRRDLTQDELAEELGVSVQTVSRWESSAKTSYPDIELLPAIAGFFGVTVDELLGCSKAQSDERLAKYWEEVNDCKDDGNKRMSILRQMYKEYPNNFDVMYNICWTGTYGVSNRFEPENVALVRECA